MFYGKSNMSIYAKLAEILAARPGSSWKVSFPELERLIGSKLPSSAFKYPAWWSNNPTNNAMTKIWLKAGWRTEQVDIVGQSVMFRRVRAAQAASRAGFGDRPREFEYASAHAPETKMATKELSMQAAAKQESAGNDGKTPFERLYGCLKGAIKIAPGVDLTEPAWGKAEWEAWEAKWDRLLPRKDARG
jgi:hypothetical protein